MKKHFKTIEVDDTVLESLDCVSRPADVRLPGVTKEFLLSGRAFFRVTNARTKKEITFKVHARVRESSPWAPTFFVRVQGALGSYRYLAVLLDDGSLKITGRSEFTPKSLEFSVATWAIRCVYDEAPLPAGYSIENIGKCGKCGWTLIDESDKKLGLHAGCRL